MNDELKTMQTELTIARQEKEIMELKWRLQKTQAEKSSRLEDSLFAPSLYEHYQKVAVTLSKSGVIPTAYRGKPEDIFVAMAMGYQLGFPVEQSLQDVAVINGRPCLWGDGLLSLCLNHPECQKINEDPILNGNNIIGYSCTVVRKGHEPHTQTFTMQDAEHAGLLKKGGVWKSYPTRMLQMRARSLALRDKFADALRGLRIAEIEEDDGRIIEAETTEVKAPTQTEKLKKILSTEREESTEIPVHNSGRDDVLVSDEDIKEIESLMHQKKFDSARRKKALDYFKVDEMEELSEAQAKVFLLQLGKA